MNKNDGSDHQKFFDSFIKITIYSCIIIIILLVLMYFFLVV